MEFRNSFSRLKKKVKHKLAGSKSKSTKAGADTGGSGLDPTGSHPGSEPHLVASDGHDQEGSGANTDESAIRPPQPDEPSSVQAPGDANDQERKDPDIDGGGVEQTYPDLHPVDIEVAEGSGPAEGKDADGEKVEQLDPSPPTTSIPHDGKPNSA